jgi:UDP-GlcNAc:undecaprenyl-phosphate GlcNAc-1-phosphate transferase
MTRLSLLHHLAFCAVLTLLSALVVRAMIQVRVIDRPSPRKAHFEPTPKGGGVGIVAAFVVGIAVLYAFAAFSRLANGYFIGVIGASIAIAVVAFLDDLRDWPFSIKLAAQIGAAGAALGTGLYVSVYRVPYIGAVDIGWWGLLPSLFWILFATNAMNFIDGLDGLAAGVALIACLFLAVIGAAQGGWFLYFAALLLASGILGFIPFNFPRARIFMGDVGSQFCGFVLAVLGIAASRFDRVPMSFVLVPLLLFGVLYDVGFTLLRRLAGGEQITAAHRGHLYQVAHRAGLPAYKVTLVHWSFALFGGSCCLAFIQATSTYKPAILMLPILPQFVWTAYVWRLAHRRNIGCWSKHHSAVPSIK